MSILQIHNIRYNSVFVQTFCFVTILPVASLFHVKTAPIPALPEPQNAAQNNVSMTPL